MTEKVELDRILALVMELAAGNLDKRLEPGGESEVHDALIMGLNMLAEELQARDEVQNLQLERADRLAAVGQLAAGVAHEINNPLAYVIVNLGVIAEAINRPGIDDPELQDAINDALEGTERVRRIVRGLKTYPQHNTGLVELVHVEEAAQSVIAMVENEIRHKARIVRIYEEPPAIYCDRVQLVQVITNLLLNAIDAIPEGQSSANELRVSLRTHASGMAEIGVSDTGEGIPESALQSVFDPFFTTKAVGQGTGLGLFVCHGIVTRMGGTIEVQSQPGLTKFTVRLPKGVPPVPPAPHQARKPTSKQGRRGRVLIIDDDQKVSRALHRMLKGEHEVTTVHEGRAALSVLAEAERYFDVVFCDLMMPNMTGVEFKQRIESSFPEQASRLVFITGGAFTRAAQEMIEVSSTPIIEKPFDMDSVRALVRRYVAEADHAC